MKIDLLIPNVPGVKYDGLFLDHAPQFTDIDRSSPAYGGTFMVMPEDCTHEKVQAKRDEQRAYFAAAQKEAA